MRYRARNGTWYRIAYFDGDFRFVYIDNKVMQFCTVGHAKNGKKYLEYNGFFEICHDGTIYIR